MTQQAAENDNPPMMRRIDFFDDEQQRTLVFLTNNMKLAAATVAEIYKNRWQIGVSSQKHINQPVKVRPRLTDSSLVAWEASWSESETMKPSDNMLRKEYAQLTRLQRAVNADVASLHAIRRLRRSITCESSKSRSKRVRRGGSLRRGISDDMVRRRMWQLEKPSVSGEEISPRRCRL
jgi:hypothetical protein